MSYADAIIASGSAVFAAGTFTVLNNKIQDFVAGPPTIQPTVVIASRTRPFAATTAVAIVATITAGTVVFSALDAAGAVVAGDVGGFSYVILNNNLNLPNSG
jgi:hypothetical protein